MCFLSPNFYLYILYSTPPLTHAHLNIYIFSLLLLLLLLLLLPLLPTAFVQLLSELCRSADPSALDLLSKMLVFSPQERVAVPEERRRISVDAILNHPYFDSVRDPEFVSSACVAIRPVNSEVTDNLEAGGQLVANILREIMMYQHE